MTLLLAERKIYKTSCKSSLKQLLLLTASLGDSCILSRIAAIDATSARITHVNERTRQFHAVGSKSRKEEGNEACALDQRSDAETSGP